MAIPKKHNRPTDDEILQGVEDCGNVSKYAAEIDTPRRTVSYWYNAALKKRVLTLSEEGTITLEFIDGTERVFTESEINDFFLAYSSKGRDLNTRQMLNEFGLSPVEWHKIRQSFKVYKISNIFWDTTLQSIAPSKRAAAIEDRLASTFSNANKMVDRAYTKALQGTLKKQLDSSVFAQEYLKEFFSCLIESNLENPILSINKSICKKSANPPLVLGVSDIHIGAKNCDMKGNVIHNTEIVRRHFHTIAETTNRRQSKAVTLLINGDIIESFTGTNHPNTFQEMEFQATYANGLILARNLIMELIGAIDNLVRVLVISGNHDRMSPKSSEDTMGGVAHLLSEFITIYRPDLEVKWSPYVLTHVQANVNFIFAHGDKKFCEKDFYKVILEHGDPNMYNVVVLGHFHSRQIKHDNSKGRLMILPSIAQGGQFANDHGFNARAGFTLFEANGLNLTHTDVML